MDLKTLQDTPPWDWPTDAANRFQEILISPRADESNRLIAAELAGDLTVINDRLAESLIAIICNPEEVERLRATAAVAVGPVLNLADTDGFEDPEDVPISRRVFGSIQGSLQNLHFDNRTPKEVRRRILEASVRAPAGWHQEAIRAAYSSGDRDWMLTAVFSMRWVQGFDDQILEALKSADPEIRCEAIHVAGTWELAAAWPHITALIQDTDALGCAAAGSHFERYLHTARHSEKRGDRRDTRSGCFSRFHTRDGFLAVFLCVYALTAWAKRHESSVPERGIQ